MMCLSGIAESLHNGYPCGRNDWSGQCDNAL